MFLLGHECAQLQGHLQKLRQTSPTPLTLTHGRHQNECRSRDARGQPEHPALLGAPVRFPSPRRTQGGHRQFDLVEIEALRTAFEETHNVSSAISIARERGSGPATPQRLRSAFGRFDHEEADRVLEESLSVRSVERTVEEVLLPGIEAMAADGGDAGPEYGFGWRWATAGLPPRCAPLRRPRAPTAS
jgi:hypothetical protein